MLPLRLTSVPCNMKGTNWSALARQSRVSHRKKGQIESWDIFENPMLFATQKLKHFAAAKSAKICVGNN